MTTTTIRAYDLYRQLPGLSRPDLNHWLAQLQIYSAGTIEGAGLSTTMDRRAAEYEISVYCHGYPEALEAAYAWLDGLEVITDADLKYIEEVAAGIDAALAQDVALWEAEEVPTFDARMTTEGVAATEAQGLVAGFAQGFTNVRSLDVEVDVLRMDGEDVSELLQRLQAFGEDPVVVMVHRHLGCSVPVYVGHPLPGRGRRFVASQLAVDVAEEWQRIVGFDEAVEAMQRG